MATRASGRRRLGEPASAAARAEAAAHIEGAAHVEGAAHATATAHAETTAHAEGAARAEAAAHADAAAPGAPRPAGSSLRWAVRCTLVLLGALPFCLPLARSRLPLGELGVALDRFFVPMCHRMPERTLALEGVLMPVCSRCAGIFAGVAAGAAIARPRLPMTAWRPILVAISALMVLDVVTQDLGLHPVWHPTRLATGVAFGYALATAFVTQLARRPA